MFFLESPSSVLFVDFEQVLAHYIEGIAVTPETIAEMFLSIS